MLDQIFRSISEEESKRPKYFCGQCEKEIWLNGPVTEGQKVFCLGCEGFSVPTVKQ